MNADAIRAAYTAVKEEAGPAVTIVAATKYVALEDMAVLAAAGIEVVGENRAQELVAKHRRSGTRFAGTSSVRSSPTRSSS